MSVAEGRMIPLRRRDGSIAGHALLDSCDYRALSGVTWCLDDEGYVVRSAYGTEGRRLLRMHRVIMGLEYGNPRKVDHINGNACDNRRHNLRLATTAENGQNRRRARNNTSGTSGVTWSEREGRWQARVGLNGKRVWLGYHNSPEAAAMVVAAFKMQHMPFSPEARRA